MTVASVLSDLVRHPARNLVHRWNWKAAVFSAASRGLLFCVINLSAGPVAGLRALATEAALRGATAGFYGAITQALSRATPAWAGNLCAVILLPSIAHTAEYLVHRAAGTPRLGTSILASVLFTVFATLFNSFAMRRGVLTVGPESGSLRSDLRALPRITVAFVAATLRYFRRRSNRGHSVPLASRPTEIRS